MRFSCVGLVVMLLGISVVRASGEPVLHEVTDALLPSNVFNVVTFASPRDIKLADLGLAEAGLAGAPRFHKADEIRVFVSRDKMKESPKARLWFNTKENAWWYYSGGQGSAGDFVLRAGEMLVVYTRISAARIPWVNPLR